MNEMEFNENWELAENSELAELDQLLDSELPEARAQACALRLTEDAAVAEVLEKLRTDRDLRGQVWAQCMPGVQAADAFSERAIRAARRLAWQTRWNRAMRFTGAAAACILVGFITGWSGRSHGVATLTPPAGGGEVVIGNPAPGGANSFPVSDHPNARPGAYYVELTDASGRPIAVQRFDNLGEAQEFARDLNHAQATRAADGPTIPLSPTQPQAQRPLVVPVSDEY